MADPFDPYLHWLGIRDPERPPNHYRLLGVALFEDDADVLANAADRQMSHVRTFQTGRHSVESQKLLNELAGAKVCLLNPAKKGPYDAALRAGQGRGLPPPPPVTPPAPPSAEPRFPPSAEPPAPPPIEPGRASRTSFPTRPLPAETIEGATEPEGVMLVTPIPSPPRLPRPVAPSPRSSSSTAMLLALMGVLVLLILGLIYLLRNVDALREKLTDSLGVPTAGADDEDALARDQGPAPKPKAKPQAELPAKAKPQADVKPPAKPEPKAEPEPKPEPEPEPRPEPRPEPPRPKPRKDARLDVPGEDAQSAALKEVREVFKDRYAAAKERDPKRALALFLRQKAADTRDNPTARFVLYTESRDMAVAAGEARLLPDVIQDLGRQYRLDWQEMFVDTLVKASKRPRDSLGNQALARLALETARGRMARQDYDPAAPLGEAAREMARKAGDVATVKQAVALLKDVAERKQALAAFLELPAEKRGAEDFGDPQSNWIAARYYCLVKDDWPRGLALVVRSGEAALRDAAQSELDHPPREPAQMVTAGEHWYEAAKTADELGRRLAHGRAIYWYQRAAHNASGLTRTKVERRLAELDK